MRQYNVPAAICALLVLGVLLGCLFLPAAVSFSIAASQDSFIFGPSTWWNVGEIALFLGAVVLCLAVRRIRRA